MCHECSSKYSPAINKSGLPASSLSLDALLSIREKEDKRRRNQFIMIFSAFAVMMVISIVTLHNSVQKQKSNTPPQNVEQSVESGTDSSKDSNKPSTSSSTSSKPSNNQSSSSNSTKKENSVSYSSNNKVDAKKGNKGIYAYKSLGKSYDIYYIIDFDEQYVYCFQEGDSNTTCERIKIVSGTLNDYVLITYHDGGDTWDNALHFKWVNQPDILVVEDSDHFEWEYTTTDLSAALQKMSTKNIIDY